MAQVGIVLALDVSADREPVRTAWKDGTKNNRTSDGEFKMTDLLHSFEPPSVKRIALRLDSYSGPSRQWMQWQLSFAGPTSRIPHIGADNTPLSRASVEGGRTMVGLLRGRDARGSTIQLDSPSGQGHFADV